MNYLTYKGVEFPIRVSYYALKQFQLETGKGIETIDQEIGNLEILLYYALIAGSKAEDKPMKLKKEDMECMLDECLADFNKILMASFPDSKGGNDKKK